jgi:hypothetical protein
MMRPRYIAMDAWETSALIAGTMTQKRVPFDYWRYTPRPGALIWVQEPFVQWTGVKQQAMTAIGFRADAGPGGLFPDQPAFLKNVHTSFKVHEPRELRAGDSRLTLEVNKTWMRETSYFETGDRPREGLNSLSAWDRVNTQDEAWRAFWYRQYHNCVGPVLIIQFTVHRENVAHLMKTRGAA